MKVTLWCPTLRDPMNYTVHGIFQARILEWVDFPFSRGSSQPRDWTQVSPAGRFFTSWATKEANTSTWIQTPKSWLNWSWELSLVSPKKRPWCWERLRAGGEGDDRGWDGWMASLTQWTWVWADSGSWWWTGSPGRLWFMGSQKVRHNWAAELNWYHALILPFLLDTNFIPAPCKRKTASHKWDTGILLKVLEATLNKIKQYKVQSSGAVQKSILISNTNYKAGLQDPLTFVTGCNFRVYETTQYK